MNFREKFIHVHLDMLKINYSRLTEWERKFYDSVKDLTVEQFSQHQYNKLEDIAENLMRKDR